MFNQPTAKIVPWTRLNNFLGNILLYTLANKPTRTHATFCNAFLLHASFPSTRLARPDHHHRFVHRLRLISLSTSLPLLGFLVRCVPLCSFLLSRRWDQVQRALTNPSQVSFRGSGTVLERKNVLRNKKNSISRSKSLWRYRQIWSKMV